MSHPYWQQQIPGTPLYPDIAWSKPEQRSQAGKLAIIGGNKLGFAGVADSYGIALTAGVGEVRVLLPGVLKKTIPAAITDAIFAPTNPSGSLSRDALTEMKALGAWASGVLLVGDAGRSSETAIVYEDFIRDYHGQLTITRDATISSKTPLRTSSSDQTHFSSYLLRSYRNSFRQFITQSF